MKIDYPDAIRRLRAKMNISQEKLAELLGVAFSSVNRWENGHNEPTIIAKEKLKQLFTDNNIEIREVKE